MLTSPGSTIARPATDIEIQDMAQKHTNDIVHTGLSVCKLGTGVSDIAKNKVIMPCGPDEVYNRLLRNAECFEKLKLSSMTPDVRQAHRDVTLVAECAQSFNCATTYAARNLGCRSLYWILS